MNVCFPLESGYWKCVNFNFTNGGSRPIAVPCQDTTSSKLATHWVYVRVSSCCESGGARAVLLVRASRRWTCPRIFAISGGSSIQAITRSLLPHSGQVSMSMANTRLRRRIQFMGAGGLSLSTRFVRRGTMRFRCLKFGANTPWKRVRFSRGLGTRAART